MRSARYLLGLRPALYGYRVYGPYEPATRHRFNHHKLLITRHEGTGRAAALERRGYRTGASRRSALDRRQRERHAESVAVDTSFMWGNDWPPSADDRVYENARVGHARPDAAGDPRHVSGCRPCRSSSTWSTSVTTVEPPVHAFIDIACWSSGACETTGLPAHRGFSHWNRAILGPSRRVQDDGQELARGLEVVPFDAY